MVVPPWITRASSEVIHGGFCCFGVRSYADPHKTEKPRLAIDNWLTIRDLTERSARSNTEES